MRVRFYTAILELKILAAGQPCVVIRTSYDCARKLLKYTPLAAKVFFRYLRRS